MQNKADNIFRAFLPRSLRRQGAGARVFPLSPQSSVLSTNGRTRRAFTLIELLVVIGIIAVLVGILLPVINHAYKSSQTTAMKFNFHAIASALESYKQDFGDYPRNPLALTDPGPSSYSTYTYSKSTDEYRPATPRTDSTLAMALIGPGPYAAINASGLSTSYPNGDVDGAVGSGFRTQLSIVATVTATATSGMSTVTLSGAFPATNANNPLLPPFTVVSLGGPGSPDAHLVVIGISGNALTLATPVQNNYPAGSPASLLAPTGKVWGPYLQVDKFKVSYIEIPQAGQTYESKFLPVLLDTWGNPIIYMPAYNTYKNHMVSGLISAAASSGLNPGTFPLAGQPGITAPTTITVGPLLGWPLYNPSPLPSVNYSQYNTPMDTVTQSSHYTGPSVFWSGPLNYKADGTTFTTGQIAGILYQLGDHDGNNMINDTETLSVQQPYFLISAGPDGQLTDLYGINPATNAPYTAPAPNTNQYWDNLIRQSDDIYFFGQ